MKIAVLWQRFGPYHLARLRGAAEVGANASRGGDVIGIEVAAQDHYDWSPAPGASGFARRTLFADRDYASLRVAEIRQAVRRCLDELAPDAVAVNGWSAVEARAAIRWCRTHGKPVVLMSETKADDAPRRWWREWMKRRVVSGCTAALVGGRPHAAYVRALGMRADRVFLGYDAVDNDYFAAGADRAREDANALRMAQRLPARYFFACTRFLPRKNLDGLLRAYAAYRRESPDPWDLVVAGGGEEAARLRERVYALELQGVNWAGFVQYPALPVFYGLASAFVHPALAEPWGLVVNEAAASGLPLLVARPVGAASELMRDGENGILFDPDSVEDMTAALNRMSGLPEAQRAAMGARSRAIVADFSPRRFGEALWAALAPQGARCT